MKIPDMWKLHPDTERLAREGKTMEAVASLGEMDQRVGKRRVRPTRRVAAAIIEALANEEWVDLTIDEEDYVLISQRGRPPIGGGRGCSTRVGFKLETPLYERLKRESNRRNVNMSDLFRKAVSDFLGGDRD